MHYLPRECFQPALQRLDLLLYREILRLRASYQLSMDEFRGLYVSDTQVDALVRQWSTDGQHDDNIETLDQLIVDSEPDCRVALSGDNYWNYMVQRFQLSTFEQDVILLAMMPELALKYETLYAYLNNDVVRKYPTIDLALRLFTDKIHKDCRHKLSPNSKLICEQLLEPVNSNDQRWSLAAGFYLSPSVLSYLIEGVPSDARLVPGSRYLPAPDHSDMLMVPSAQLPNIKPAGVTVLEGDAGAGRVAVLRQILANQPSNQRLNLLTAELPILALSGDPLSAQLQRLLLQAKLGQAGLYLTGLDKLLNSEVSEHKYAFAALAYLRQTDVAVYLGVSMGTVWREWLTGMSVASHIFYDPELQQRQQLWQAECDRQRLSIDADDLYAVADRFILNPGQIEAAVRSFTNPISVNKSQARSFISRDVIFAAARDQSVGDIGKLAAKVSTTYQWEDLVLPRSTQALVNEAVSAITHRGLVYQQWQMQQRTGGSTGLMMMFTGSSGTGKTMCASLIAKSVGFDLYCIDLSSVVSKYIGDTEKNLDRIFTAARRANCILFFDEADALLGKRSEIKDARDRYANVEVAYLLQKMEQHDGVVIMATNIAKNIDHAFSRRLHYSIEFPRPNAEHREQLWRGIYPAQTPLADDVDFTFLGRNFEGTGGDIKTIALDAAMQAAGNQQAVNMSCLVKAMARQMIKQGKVPSAADFKHYYSLIERGSEHDHPIGKRQPVQRVVQHPSVSKQNH